ncbi:hypothetical protein [Methylocystis rosea]|uniref:Uncharacterized protein n=1 Tax=Methylocystis rosea TaxID=173366 RepID=A0A3G8M7I2_9HYPH|nr:hypothetical protein [Methylocystis rosea]AZG77060.1 hypothetical protein EHO51_10125 [Methylocystis rosea]
MKTHDAAKILMVLAQALRNAPNRDLDDFASSIAKPPQLDPASIPVALSTLVRLSEIDKRQWTTFIKEHNFPIEVRLRDASRDILGKLLKHLEQNPEARERLSKVAQRSRSETSPELMKALQFLLSQE